MRLLKYFRVAADSIAARKMRSILTMLGIIIGVAAVLTTLGLSRGLSEDIMDQLADRSITVLRIESSNVGNQIWASGQALTMADVAVLSDRSLHPDVVQVVPIYRRQMQLVVGSNNTSSAVIGTTSAYAAIHNLELAEGRFLTEDEITHKSKTIVIGGNVSKKLFGDTSAVGKSVRISREPFTVVGVLEERGFGRSGNMDDSGIIAIGVAQDRLRARNTAPRYRGDYTVTEIHADAVSIERIDVAERQLEQTLRLRRGLTRNDPNDFNINNQSWLLERANDVVTSLSVFLGSIGAISLLVGGIGIMNIMLVSVTERTKEIGLRKALGAKNDDILVQFLVEAVLMTVAGGLIGIAISYGFATFVESLSGPDLRLVVIIVPSSLIVAVSVSAACGILFGLYPAIRATRLNPIEALQHE